MTKSKRAYYGYWYEVSKKWIWTERLLKDGKIEIPKEHVKSVLDYGVVYLRRK